MGPADDGFATALSRRAAVCGKPLREGPRTPLTLANAPPCRRRLLSEHPLPLTALQLKGPSPGLDAALEADFMWRDRGDYDAEFDFESTEAPNSEDDQARVARHRPKAPPALLPVLGAIGGLQVGARGAVCGEDR